jgi:hypothetical protein
LITKRSDFFRVARLARWTKPNKATKLVDEDPDTFAAYLDRLYFGTGSVIKSSDADATRDSSSAAEKDEQKKTDEQEKKDKQEKKDIVTVNLLLDVYLLADRLLDPTTANVVIDEIIAFVDTLSWAPGQHFIARVYDSTLEGSPLRRLCRDWRVHEIPGWASRFPKAEWSLPHEYLQDLLIEIDRLQDRYYHRSIREIFGGRASSRPKGHYYQKVEQK